MGDEMDSKKNYGHVTIWLMVFLMIGKLLGLFRDSYIASVYGSNAMTDVFFLVNTTITLLSGLISQAINTCAIPILSGKHTNQSKLFYVNSLLHVIVAASLVFVVASFILLKPISKVLAPGFTVSQLSFMRKLMLIGLPCIPFYCIVGVRRAYLQSEGSFIESGISDLLLNVVYVLALLFVGRKYGVYVLMISALVASVAQMVIQRLLMLRSDYVYYFSFDLHSQDMKKTLSLVWPVFLSSCIGDINKLIDKALASTLSPGALSSLTYSSKINTLFLGIFITAVTTVIFPLLAKAANDRDNLKSFKDLICRGVNTVLAISVPCAIALMMIGSLVVRILYQRGSFTAENTFLVNNALFYYAMALPGMSVRLVAIKAFYSLQDTRTPVINGSICIVINIVLNIILKSVMGYTGLALATAIATNALAIVLLFKLYTKVNGFQASEIWSTFGKILFASMVMGIIIYVLYVFVFVDKTATFFSSCCILGILAFVGVVFYLLMSYLLKIRIVTEFVSSVIKKIMKKRR